MIEKIITSKTRVKLLKLFLTNIDDRYYLRELERKLDESLSPLRRQLVKLEKMEILITEQEANLKYYRLNKNFTGIENLRNLVLDATQEESRNYAEAGLRPDAEITRKEIASAPISSGPRNDMVLPQPQPMQKRVKYDVAILTTISIFVLAVASFMVYTNSRNMEQVAGLVSGKTTQGRASSAATATRPDEMVSRRWKLLPGNVPVLSSGVAGGEKRTEEL